MESRLKERLTGAAILVALIVLLVPEMFRGQRGSEPPAATGSSGVEGPPLRSYTIDLSNNPKGTVPLQSSGEAAAAAKDEPAGPAEATKTSGTAAPTSPTVPGAPAATAPLPTTPVVSAPPPVAPRAVRAASQAAPAAAGKAPSSGGWTVQLGLFAKRENAERLAGEARAHGFNVAVSNADAKGLFHVRTSALNDRASAQALAQRLKTAGFAAAVTAP